MEKWKRIKQDNKKTGVGISIRYTYDKVRDFMKPSENQPLPVQIILFIVKLPVLIVVLALSPIFLILMFIAFVAAL